MTADRLRAGERGEDLAAAWYRDAGYRVVRRNWRVPEGEVDLVVARGAMLVIVEVKARADDRFGGGLEAVGHRKRQRLRRLGELLVEELGSNRTEVRFDVVAVGPAGLEVIEHAF